MDLLSLPVNRLFSPAEANDLVPILQLSFAAISEIKLSVEADLRELSEGAPERLAGILEGKEPPPPGSEGKVERLQSSLRELGEAIEGITSQGMIIQEMEPGVVDFPSLVGGRLVLLCWQFGEATVGHFHEVEAAFEERQALPNYEPLLH